MLHHIISHYYFSVGVAKVMSVKKESYYILIIDYKNIFSSEIMCTDVWKKGKFGLHVDYICLKVKCVISGQLASPDRTAKTMTGFKHSPCLNQ